jgi:hypothetical protein
MTAIVTDDAELGFVSSEAKALLHDQPQAYQELLAILTAKIVQTDEVTKAMLAARKSTPGSPLEFA